MPQIFPDQGLTPSGVADTAVHQLQGSPERCDFLGFPSRGLSQPALTADGRGWNLCDERFWHRVDGVYSQDKDVSKSSPAGAAGRSEGGGGGVVARSAVGSVAGAFGRITGTGRAVGGLGGLGWPPVWPDNGKGVATYAP